MEGKEVAPFALIYCRQMTGHLGYTKQAGYKFWHVFAGQALRRLGLTDEAEISLRVIGFVKCHGDIARFLPEMENLRIDTTVTGIAWGQIMEDQIPKDVL